MNNLDVRQAIYAKRLKHYEVAQALGISQSMFSKMLQRELDDKEKKKIMQAIRHIK